MVPDVNCWLLGLVIFTAEWLLVLLWCVTYGVWNVEQLTNMS